MEVGRNHRMPHYIPTPFPSPTFIHTQVMTINIVHQPLERPKQLVSVSYSSVAVTRSTNEPGSNIIYVAKKLQTVMDPPSVINKPITQLYILKKVPKSEGQVRFLHQVKYLVYYLQILYGKLDKHPCALVSKCFKPFLPFHRTDYAKKMCVKFYLRNRKSCKNLCYDVCM